MSISLVRWSDVYSAGVQLAQTCGAIGKQGGAATVDCKLYEGFDVAGRTRLTLPKVWSAAQRLHYFSGKMVLTLTGS